MSALLQNVVERRKNGSSLGLVTSLSALPCRRRLENPSVSSNWGLSGVIYLLDSFNANRGLRVIPSAWGSRRRRKCGGLRGGPVKLGLSWGIVETLPPTKIAPSDCTETKGRSPFKKRKSRILMRNCAICRRSSSCHMISGRRLPSVIAARECLSRKSRPYFG